MSHADELCSDRLRKRSNALDFHIAYYLGVLASADPSGYFRVISKDTGFDPLIQHLKGKGIACDRSDSIEGMPCFRRATASTSDSNRAANKSKDKIPVVQRSVNELVTVVVNNLIKRKTARPRTRKTLCGTIHARCGRELPAADIDAVYEALVDRGYVKVDGSKLTYSLPAE